MPGSWPGFSFALHLLRAQGFYFALLQYSLMQAFTTRFTQSIQSYRPFRKTTHRALQGRFRQFALFCRRCVAGTSAYTAPPAPRWSTHTRPDSLHRYQIPAPHRTLYRSAQQPYYNKVYKGAAAPPCYGSMPDGAAYHKPCQPGGVSVLPTVSGQGAPAGTLHPAGQSSSRGAESLMATAVSLFGLSPDS